MHIFICDIESSTTDKTHLHLCEFNVVMQDESAFAKQQVTDSNQTPGPGGSI